MPLTAPTPHSDPTINVDAETIRELLEQHRAARIDRIKACIFSDPMGDATGPEVSRSALDAARLALNEIDFALARMDEGSFGVCIGCCRRIGQERLYAVPYARLLRTLRRPVSRRTPARPARTCIRASGMTFERRLNTAGSSHGCR